MNLMRQRVLYLLSFLDPLDIDKSGARSITIYIVDKELNWLPLKDIRR